MVVVVYLVYQRGVSIGLGCYSFDSIVVWFVLCNDALIKEAFYSPRFSNSLFRHRISNNHVLQCITNAIYAGQRVVLSFVLQPHTCNNSYMNKDKVYTIRFTTREWEAINKRWLRYDGELSLAQYIRKMIDLGENSNYKKGSDW